MSDSDRQYYERVRALLEESYLAADARGDVFGGSGCGAKNAAHWEARRRVITGAFDRDGTWLDVGCANGLLMETMAAWVAEKGYRIEPYGLDLSERIAATARRRLPRWADRIWTGNVMDFEPPIRFDYITALADAVPEHRITDMIARLATRFLKPGGRLVLSCYTPGAFLVNRAGDPRSAPDLLRAAGFEPAGDTQARDAQSGIIKAWVAWTDVAAQS
jgi:2-polyprenyl-3-methyl-5-hydroxy-6-metoxy-1,4-benzoquinol methylase